MSHSSKEAAIGALGIAIVVIIAVTAYAFLSPQQRSKPKALPTELSSPTASSTRSVDLPPPSGISSPTATSTPNFPTGASPTR